MEVVLILPRATFQFNLHGLLEIMCAQFTDLQVVEAQKMMFGGGLSIFLSDLFHLNADVKKLTILFIKFNLKFNSLIKF